METNLKTLYPLKFNPIIKSKIWGGSKLKEVLHKNAPEDAGESWEISGVKGDISVVKNGFLAGNNIQELIEVYMGDLVGDAVFDKFGLEFPLLIKFIDARDDLSIQVHPDDKLAAERHESFGKTEMWCVLQADKGAELITGFKRELNKDIYLEHLDKKLLKNILNFEKVDTGDIFFIPAGRVHAIGAGILLAEIQQTSDVTYRIYDWDRKDKEGNERELHTDLALDAIDYSVKSTYKTEYNTGKLNQSVPTVDCPYFTTNFLHIDRTIEKDYIKLHSFVIYICMSGSFSIAYGDDQMVEVTTGETVLLPSIINNVNLIPQNNAELLEVYITS